MARKVTVIAPEPALKIAPIEFGEFLPDQGEFFNPGVISAKNVIPGTAGYRPLPSPAVFSSGTMDSNPLGAIGVTNQAGVGMIFGGDTAKLYQLNNGTKSWSDVSRVAGYATGTEDKWRFANYGAYLIATNYSDHPQKFDLGTDTEFSDLTTDFKARYVTTSGDFLVFAHTNDPINGVLPSRIWWSGLGQFDTYTPDQTTMAGYLDMYEAGIATGLVGYGDYFLAFTERSIQRFDFQGPPYIFSRRAISIGKGCIAPDSIVAVGNLVYFLSEDGFYVTDGNSIKAIGAEKWNKWFFETAGPNNYKSVTGVNDPFHNTIYWSFQSPSGQNTVLIYNYEANRAAWAEYDLSMLVQLVTIATTLEQLDVYGSLENIPASLDSRIWSGGELFMAGLTSTGAVVSLTGTPLAASITPAFQMLAPPGRALVRSVHPMADGGTISVKVASQNIPNANYTLSNPSSQNSLGYCPVRSQGRYHIFEVTITGSDWKLINGIQVYYVKSSGR